MKKVIFTLALAGTFVAATAQDILPTKGSYALGINAAPFLTYVGSMFTAGTNTAPAFNSQSPFTINGKYFSADNRAWRASLTLGITNSKGEFTSPTDPTKTMEAKQNSATIILGVGYEYKRVSGKRLVFSYGPQLAIGKIAGSVFDPRIGSPLSGKVEITDNGLAADQTTTYEGGNTTVFGIGAFAGVEYFVLPKISIGGEFNTSLNYLSTSKTTSTTGGTETIIGRESSGLSFGNFVTGAGTTDGTQVATLNLSFYF